MSERVWIKRMGPMEVLFSNHHEGAEEYCPVKELAALKEENKRLREIIKDIELQIEAEIRAERGLPLSEFGEGFNHAKHEVLAYIKMKTKALAQLKDDTKKEGEF